MVYTGIQTCNNTFSLSRGAVAVLDTKIETIINILGMSSMP